MIAAASFQPCAASDGLTRATSSSARSSSNVGWRYPVGEMTEVFGERARQADHHFRLGDSPHARRQEGNRLARSELSRQGLRPMARQSRMSRRLLNRRRSDRAPEQESARLMAGFMKRDAFEGDVAHALPLRCFGLRRHSHPRTRVFFDGSG